MICPKAAFLHINNKSHVHSLIIIIIKKYPQMMANTSKGTATWTTLHTQRRGF